MGELLVRPAAVADAVVIAAIYAYYVRDTVITFEIDPAPDAAAFTDRMAADPRLPWLVAERDGEVIGYAYASAHRTRAAYRWAADVSIYLDRRERRRGAGRALYEALLPVLRDLGYVSAIAGVTLPNAASVGLHEALGFELVGVYRDIGFKDGAWHDVGWWQLRLADPLPPEPDEPRAWTSAPSR